MAVYLGPVFLVGSVFVWVKILERTRRGGGQVGPTVGDSSCKSGGGTRGGVSVGRALVCTVCLLSGLLAEKKRRHVVVADALPGCRNRQFSRAIRTKKVFISRPPWMVRNRRRGRSSGVPKSAAFEGNSGQKWVLLRDANVLRKTMRGRSCPQTGGGPKR